MIWRWLFGGLVVMLMRRMSRWRVFGSKVRMVYV